MEQVFGEHKEGVESRRRNGEGKQVESERELSWVLEQAQLLKKMVNRSDILEEGL